MSDSRSWTQSLLGRLKLAGKPQSVYFLVSSPRSGSTWTRVALNAHPQVCCVENSLFGEFYEVRVNNIADGKGTLRSTMDAYATVLCRTAYEKVPGLSRKQFREGLIAELIETLLRYQLTTTGKRVLCDKVTPALGRARLVARDLKKFLPQAKVIYLHRDGRDVVVSGVCDWLNMAVDGREMSAFQKRRYDTLLQTKEGEIERFFEPAEIETWIAYWRDPLENLLGMADLTTSYERLKRDQQAELGRIFEFMGEIASADVLQQCVTQSSFEKMTGGRKPGDEVREAKARKGIVGDWRNYFTRQDGELFHELAGDWLIKLGYEKDASWFKELPETRRFSSEPSVGHTANA